MIYLTKTKVTLNKPHNEKTVKEILEGQFTIDAKPNYFTITRNRQAANRGILRFLFPVLVSKIIVKNSFLYCKTKLDGFAFFVLLMSAGAILGRFIVDENRYPQEFPVLFPICIFTWYVFSLLIEAYRIKTTLAKRLLGY